MARRVLSGLLLASLGWLSGASALAGAPELIPGHFRLTAVDGHAVSDTDFRGKWLLVYFGYTYCPDVCPTVLLRIGKALRNIGAGANNIVPVFITVDPDRDTATHLAQYLAAFDSKIVGLRGTAEQTAAAAKSFHVYYRARALGGEGEYTVDHSSLLYLIRPDGEFAKLLPDSLSEPQLEGELRKCGP